MGKCEKCHMEHVQQIRVLINGIDISFNFCPNSELTIFSRRDYLKIGAPKIVERSIVIRVTNGDQLMLANKFSCSVMLANSFKADGLHALVFQSEIVTGASVENSILGMDWLSFFRPYGTPPLSKSLFLASNACPTPDFPLLTVSNVETDIARQFLYRSAHCNMNDHKCPKCGYAHPHQIELLVNGIELLFEVCIVAEHSFLCDNDFTKIRNAEIVEENVPFFGSNGETYVADKFICSVETNVSKRGKPMVLTGLVFYSEDITKSTVGIDWLTALNLTINFPSRPNDLIFSAKDCVTKEKRFPFWVSNVETDIARQFLYRSAHCNMNDHKCPKCGYAHPHQIELLVNGIELLFEVCIVAEHSFLCDNDFTKIRNAEIVEENVPFFGSNGETYVADKFICSVETNVSKRGKPMVLTGLVFYSEDITKSTVGIDWLTALNLTINFPSRPNDLIFSAKDCVTKEKRFPFWVFKYSLKATKKTSPS